MNQTTCHQNRVTTTLIISENINIRTIVRISGNYKIIHCGGWEAALTVIGNFFFGLFKEGIQVRDGGINIVLLIYDNMTDRLLR